MPQQHFLYKQIGTNCCIAKFQALVFCEHYEQLALLLMIINSWFYPDLTPGCIKMRNAFLGDNVKFRISKASHGNLKLLCCIANW